MRLFLTQFLKDLFWFTSSWADTSKETAGDYTYTEVREVRSGVFLYNKDHTPTGVIGRFVPRITVRTKNVCQGSRRRFCNLLFSR